jgi:predicted nucleotidyltransferase component of viral defense system
MMDSLEFIDFVKRKTLVAMFSDDELMERLVLKGGNALDLVYGISTRASVDLDFSLDGEFSGIDELRE